VFVRARDSSHSRRLEVAELDLDVEKLRFVILRVRGDNLACDAHRLLQKLFCLLASTLSDLEVIISA
jgi:hypothetical protein